jgi:hypothetical protein
VVGLGEKDFRISENGKWQDVALFSSERRPIRLALALDMSRSMENKARQVEAALEHFIDLLEPAPRPSATSARTPGGPGFRFSRSASTAGPCSTKW